MSSGKSRAVPTVPDLGEDEVVRAHWFVGIPYKAFGGRFSKIGGTLVLTSRRLVFEPLLAGSRLAGAAGLAGTRAYRGSVALDDVERAEPIPGRMPRLRLVMKDGEEAVYVVVERRWSHPWGKQNYGPRDEAVREVTAALDGAG